MSRRARSARRMSTILTEKSHTHVVVAYDRPTSHYCVRWTGDMSTIERMRQLIAGVDPTEVPELDLPRLVLLRSEPRPSTWPS